MKLNLSELRKEMSDMRDNIQSFITETHRFVEDNEQYAQLEGLISQFKASVE